VLLKLAVKLITVFALLSISQTAMGACLLENGRLKVSIEPQGCIIEITEKASGRVFVTEDVSSFRLIESVSVQDTCCLTYEVQPDDFTVTARVSLDENSLVFRINSDPETPMTKHFKFPGSIESGDGDYYIVPYASGYIGPVTEPYPLGNPLGRFHMWGYKSTMPFAGITDLSSGYMITSDDPWDTEIAIARPSWSIPNYTLMLNHHPSKGTFGYNRTFYYSFFSSGGYVAMCDWYRRHAEKRGYVRTLRDKANENPAVDRLIGAVDFWSFTSYWAGSLIDTLVDYGFDRVLYTFTTNYVSFPDNSTLIDKAHEAGFLTSRYDCFTDVYPPDKHPEINWLEREGYPENIIIDADGGLHGGWITYLSDGSAFQCGVSCSKTHDQYARRKISRDLSVNDYSARFIDVELASTLYECYSPEHPASRHDDAVHRALTLGIVKDEYNLVTGSEEARDWAFPNCDYGEGTLSVVAPDNAGYDWATPLDDPGERFIDISMNASRRVPLHGLVYHDTHVATWYTGDSATKVPAYRDHKDLFTILYGTMHIFMPGNMERWTENLEHFVTSYHTTSAVFGNVGYERMTSHEMLSPDFMVQKTTFANGWTVVANFGSSEYGYDGKSLAPLGFYAFKGDEEAMKIVENGGTYTAVRLDNRLFLNPYGRKTAFHGVSSTGPVFLSTDGENRLHAAMIGSTEWIDIKPQELPWPAESIRAFSKDGGVVNMQDVGGGWLRIRRPSESDCLTIEYDPIVSVDDTDGSVPSAPDLNVYPNPFNTAATVSYTLNESGRVSIELFNLVGQKVATLETENRMPGSYRTILDGGNLTSGMYFVRFRTKNHSLTRKLLFVK